MSKDSTHTYLHLHKSAHADLLEDFTRTRLPAEEIYVQPQHKPPNPEDEDDVVPNEHAAFGIQRATQRLQEPAWRDLGLDRILNAGPPETAPSAGGQHGIGAGTPVAGRASAIRTMR